jgi:predicted metal-binding membrane protein
LGKVLRVAHREDRFDNLDGAGRAVAALAASPRGVVYALVAGAVVFSWIVIAAMAARQAEMFGEAATGPGASLLRFLPDLPLPPFLSTFFRLCLTPAPAAGGAIQFAALAGMWFLMSLAMMLPSAMPMIRTYCEIADTAKAKGEPVVHPLILVAGYLAIWIAASLAFAAVNLAVGAVLGAGIGLSPAGGAVAAGALAVAGLYQFSGLKEACLEKCRNPFATLFSRWSTRTSRIFRLGLDQGVWCLGCCWALMLVMFAVGVMNLFWMALIGLFAVVEKQVGGTLPSRVVGAILLVWSAALLLSAG